MGCEKKVVPFIVAGTGMYLKKLIAAGSNNLDGMMLPVNRLPLLSRNCIGLLKGFAGLFPSSSAEKFPVRSAAVGNVAL